MIDRGKYELYDSIVQEVRMASVSVSEFRQHIHMMLERVMQGEELVLTRRGKVIAVVGPPQERRKAARQELADLRKKARVGDAFGELRMLLTDEKYEFAVGARRDRSNAFAEELNELSD